MQNIRKATAVLLCAAMLGTAGMTGCSKQAPAEQPPAAEQTEAKVVAPQPVGFDIKDGIQDATFPVRFTADNFDGTELAVVIYNRDLYDAVDITTLKPGDTVVVQGKEIVVETAEDKNGGIQVNGGLGESETGTTFAPNEGGTYVVQLMDDYNTFTELGSWAYPVADNCVLKDEHWDDNSGKIVTTEVQRDELAEYLQELKENGRDNFNELNATICVEGGKVIEINRRYTP